ncbi:MAG: hypothetical protein GWP61_07965 [Chloroflexi bacterium]|jgi:hypothetical protein|nr:hypothetical protein [Chloroflexota bacterium]
MKEMFERLGIIPYLILGGGLLLLGLMAMNHIVDNWWPFDVERLDLVRATALDQVDPASLMAAANKEIILAFLSAVIVSATGLALPVAYFLNWRFGTSQGGSAPHFLVVLRQAMWVGFWVSFCMWLQMNRLLGVAVAILVAGVLVLLEVLLQIRTRATKVSV